MAQEKAGCIYFRSPGGGYISQRFIAASSEKGTRSGLSEWITSSWHSNQQSIFTGILHAVLLELCCCLGNLDPLHTGLQLQLLHQSLHSAQVRVWRHVLSSRRRTRCRGKEHPRYISAKGPTMKVSTLQAPAANMGIRLQPLWVCGCKVLSVQWSH